MENLTRKQRDEIRKRGEILEAALSIFASRGFHGTTMAMISKQAQYPLGTIYKYFPGKKEMYHDLVVERVRKLGQILFDISRDESREPCEKLKDCMLAQAEFYKANQEVVKIYIFERSNIDSVAMPKLNERVNRQHEKMVVLFQQILEQGMASKVFKIFPSRETAELFTDIVHSAAWSSLFRDEDDLARKQRLCMMFDIFTKGVLA